MDLPVTLQQFQAIKSAKHLPDVLARVLEKASKDGDRYRLHLTYEEATALQELAAWNVHTDANGDVAPASRVFDDLVRAILTHPDY